MDTPSPRKKKLLYDFFLCILGMMLIDGHSYLKSLDPPLFVVMVVLPSVANSLLKYFGFSRVCTSGDSTYDVLAVRFVHRQALILTLEEYD